MPPTAPKVDEFEDDVFLYLAIYIPTQGFCQKTDVSQKSTITNHDLKKIVKIQLLAFFLTVSHAAWVSRVFGKEATSFSGGKGGLTAAVVRYLCMYMFLYVCTYIRMYS